MVPLFYMNIFATDNDPIIAAQNLCDQHVRSKMQVEGSIMLAHAFPQELLNHPSTPKTKSGKNRKAGKGYYNHVCSVWARATKDNFMWLVDHTLEMFTERMFRYPKSNEHFTLGFIEWCKKNAHNTTITRTGLTPFGVAININSNCYKVPGFAGMSEVDKYREFIKHDKEFATWTVRPKPEWY